MLARRFQRRPEHQNTLVTLCVYFNHEDHIYLNIVK